ncbi:Fructose-2,6-bisphosphatase [Tulasnella sp. 417]|nr:Fructose-2,6-bisphosphatase [Tulasnella sp. 417]
MPAPVSMPGIGKIIKTPDYSKVKIVLALVGLPARGKSSLAKKLLRYLTWLEYKVKIFNVGELRRKKASEEEKTQGFHGTNKPSSFDHTHAETLHSAEKIAEESLENLIFWMKSGGNIGIHDARNTNRARRARITSRVSQEPGFKLVFLETICEDPAIIEANIALRVSVEDPDYNGLSQEEAFEIYMQGIKQCEAVYETMELFEWEGMPQENEGMSPEALEAERLRLVDAAAQSPGQNNPRVALVTKEMAKNVSYMKITDVGKQAKRSAFDFKHGECLYNVENRIGGDVGLSRIGDAYARELPSVIYNAVGDQPMTVKTVFERSHQPDPV